MQREQRLKTGGPWCQPTGLFTAWLEKKWVGHLIVPPDPFWPASQPSCLSSFHPSYVLLPREPSLSVTGFASSFRTQFCLFGCADVAPHSFPSTVCRVSYTAVRSVYCTPYSQFGLYHHFDNPFSSFRPLNRSQTQFVWLQIFLVTHARTHIYMDVRIYRSGAEV